MAQGIAQLSAAMAVGDAEAVDAFYREYFDWMYCQARRVTRRDESFCLDVVQDAVLRVIRTVKPVDEEGRFRGWLQLVVKTTAFDLLRNERRRKNREAMAGVVATAAEPDVDSLQLDWLQDQITRLDPEIVKIIELRFEQSWTLRRIGETLGVSIGAVDGRLRRALTQLRLAAEELPEAAESPALPTEPATKANAEAGASTATALDTTVDVVAPPVAEIGEPVVEVATVTAAVAQAESVLHGDAEAKPATVTEALVEVTERVNQESVATPPADVVDQMPQAELTPEPTAVSEPQNEVEAVAGPGAIVTAAMDLALAMSEPPVEVVAPLAEVLPHVESLLEAESPAMGETVPTEPVTEISPPLIEAQKAEPAAVEVFPAVAARAAVVDADADLREYAVAVNAVELMEVPELVGLEDEAGWYDDWL